MKIAYLEVGPLLDYGVAVAAGYESVYQAESAEGPCVRINKIHDHGGELVPMPLRPFNPSTSWRDAGPFID